MPCVEWTLPILHPPLTGIDVEVDYGRVGIAREYEEAYGGGRQVTTETAGAEILSGGIQQAELPSRLAPARPGVRRRPGLGEGLQPGAPGQASTVVSSVPAFHDNNFTEDDVKFMQGMIHHHSQALQMVAMIATHTKTPELHAMGQKIQLSQSGEIQAMKEWLEARKQTVPMLNADGTVSSSHTKPNTAGFGAVNGANTARNLQLTARFSF